MRALGSDKAARGGRLADSSAGVASTRWDAPRAPCRSGAPVSYTCAAPAPTCIGPCAYAPLLPPPISSLWRPGTVLAARLAREAVQGRPTEGRRTQTSPDTGRKEGMHSDTLEDEAEAVARMASSGGLLQGRGTAGRDTDARQEGG